MNIYARNCNCKLCSHALIITVLKNKMWPIRHILEQYVSVWIALVIWALMMRCAGLANIPGRTKSESLTVLLLKNISFFKCATLPSWHCTKRYTVWDLDQGAVGIKKKRERERDAVWNGTLLQGRATSCDILMRLAWGIETLAYEERRWRKKKPLWFVKWSLHQEWKKNRALMNVDNKRLWCQASHC